MTLTIFSECHFAGVVKSNEGGGLCQFADGECRNSLYSELYSSNTELLGGLALPPTSAACGWPLSTEGLDRTLSVLQVIDLTNNLGSLFNACLIQFDTRHHGTYLVKQLGFKGFNTIVIGVWPLRL